ncbi:MAG: protease pro-enzyme activation domain-containing protein [Limisphaerales bacterium]
MGLLLFLAAATHATELQFVQGQLPAFIAHQQPIGRVAASNRLDIAFGLPLRNPHGLTNLLRQMYQRGNPIFHHYLTPDEFAAAFGPTEADYQSVIDFAKSQGFTITGTHPNRTLVDVNGAVGDIERALHVHLRLYQHPTENRIFYAPDAQPAIDLQTPVLTIGGLHNYTLPHPCIRLAPGVPPVAGQPQAGSGNSGSYFAGDFRAAYAHGVSLTGVGQAVGLFELDGYAPSDITGYENQAGMTNDPPLTNILIDGYSGAATSPDNTEVCADIEMAVAMAPGLTNVLVYEGNPDTNTIINDVLNRMATDNAAAQLSCSWLFDISASTEQIFQQFAAQGQSFFEASGDSRAYAGPVWEPADEPNITVVGGTELSTTGPLGSWTSETTWPYSSGGISEVFPIPFWQQGLNMAANQGSTTMRNLPDVSLVADNLLLWVNGGPTTEYSGTSFAAPLWAAFTALVNEQAALNGQPQVGFVNPAIYDIGRSSNYTSCFHDITTGNNTSADSPENFHAVAGYDLCTGWGTPIGSNLIAALLAPQDAIVITPETGFTAIGPVGGPFTVTSENYLLTNAGNTSLNWTVANTAPWLSLFPTGGELLPGGPGVTVTAVLNSAASNLLIGDFSGTVLFTNLQDNVAQSWPFALLSGNGGFETGDFSFWNFSGDSSQSFASAIDDSTLGGGSDPLPGIPYSAFVHSGLYGAVLGQAGSLGSLSQTIPTLASQLYLVSCWLSSYAYNGSTTPNEFRVKWNGAALFDQTDMGAFGWTNLQFIVAASGGATTLEFDFRDDPAALGLDDITVQPIPNPVFQTVALTNGTLFFTWNALSGLAYQLQFTTNLATANWANLGGPTSATSGVVTTTDMNPTDRQRFYRFVLSP